MTIDNSQLKIKLTSRFSFSSSFSSQLFLARPKIKIVYSVNQALFPIYHIPYRHPTGIRCLPIFHYCSNSYTPLPTPWIKKGKLNLTYKIYKEDYKKALDDITKAINIDPAQPDNYVLGGFLYVEMEKYKDTINDLTKALESEDFKEEAQLYFYRALCYAPTDKIKLARQNVQSAYNYTEDPELEELLQGLWRRLH